MRTRNIIVNVVLEENENSFKYGGGGYKVRIESSPLGLIDVSNGH